MTKLTYTQQQYLLELEDGPKTTQELVMAMYVSGSFVTRMMKRLRKAGMVRSSRVLGVRGNVWQHELIRSSEVTNKHTKSDLLKSLNKFLKANSEARKLQKEFETMLAEYSDLDELPVTMDWYIDMDIGGTPNATDGDMDLIIQQSKHQTFRFT